MKRNCFIAFTCNAKNFAIAFLILRLRVTQNALQLPFYFSALFFLYNVFGRTNEGFRCFFRQLLL